MVLKMEKKWEKVLILQRDLMLESKQKKCAYSNSLICTFKWCLDAQTSQNLAAQVYGLENGQKSTKMSFWRWLCEPLRIRSRGWFQQFHMDISKLSIWFLCLSKTYNSKMAEKVWKVNKKSKLSLTFWSFEILTFLMVGTVLDDDFKVVYGLRNHGICFKSLMVWFVEMSFLGHFCTWANLLPSCSRGVLGVNGLYKHFI